MEDEKRIAARDFVERLLDVPEGATSFIDDNVSGALPPGTQIVEFGPHGTAYWTKTLAIKTIQASGAPRRYFLKSLKTIHSLLPGFAPEPIAQGSYTSDPGVHFLLMGFMDLTGDVPDVDSLPAKLAEMHLKGLSPNGKFGFHLPSGLPYLQGDFEQPDTWTSSWETLLLVCGNQIRASLLHGNLWDGNTGTDAATEEPLIFDPTCFYGHNEYDLGPWNLPRHKIHRTYIREYQRHFERSDQKEDCEDRLLLYRHRFELSAAGCFPNMLMCRELTIPDMWYLVEKYPNGYEGPHSRKEEDR